jgi:hypothetical protein
MSDRATELETLLSRATISVVNLESSLVAAKDRVAYLEKQVKDKQELVRRTTASLDQWVNAPTKTKQQVMAKAKELGIEVHDHGLYDGYYEIDIYAPDGFMITNAECSSRNYVYHKDEATKGMLWHIVFDDLDICESAEWDEEEAS